MRFSNTFARHWTPNGSFLQRPPQASLQYRPRLRFHLPFKAATHHAVSPFRCVLPPSSDLLTLPPSRQALQVAWNAAWHSGMDNLLEELPRAASSSTSPKYQSSRFYFYTLSFLPRPPFFFFFFFFLTLGVICWQIFTFSQTSEISAELPRVKKHQTKKRKERHFSL